MTAIDAAVTDEWRRRRRVSRIYLALLLVPIAAAVVAVRYGESERAVVEKRVVSEVVPGVTNLVTKGLDEQVTARVRAAAPPVVRAALAEQVTPALSQINKKQDELASQVETVRVRSESFAAVSPEVERLRAELQTYQSQVAKMDDQVRRLTDLSARLSRVEQTMPGLDKRVMQLERGIRAPVRQP